MTETTVIIVTYNSCEDIEASIQSVRPARGVSIVVIDNDSTDGTQSVLRRLEQRGDIDHLILSPTNDGFARAVNRGLTFAESSDVFLLNPDATIGAESLERLREVAASNPKIGIVAPLVDNGPQVRAIGAGRQPTIWPLFTHFSGLARIFPAVRILRGRHLYQGPHGSTEQDVEWVSGCAMYITRTALAEVGSFSEKWFMYGEDIEFARRVSKAGFTIRMTPQAQAWHAIGTSVNAASSRVSTMWAENTYAYYVSEFRPGLVRQFAWKAIFSCGLGLRALLIWLKGMRPGTPEEKLSRRARSRRFFAFARAVWWVRPEAS